MALVISKVPMLVVDEEGTLAGSCVIITSG